MTDITNNRDLRTEPQTALELYHREAQEAEITRQIQKAVVPLFFNVLNTLGRIQDRLRGLEFQKATLEGNRITWWSNAIDTALELLREDENNTEKWLLVRRLQLILKTNKYTAEQVLKLAEKRLGGTDKFDLSKWM